MPCFKTRNLRKFESRGKPQRSTSPDKSKGNTSVDLIVSASLFILGVVFFVQIITYVVTSYGMESEQGIKDKLAGSVAGVLFGSEGVPRNWEDAPAAAKQLGLCTNFTKICLVSPGKLSALGSLSPTDAKRLLNIGDMDFRVLVKDTDSNTAVFEYKTADIGRELAVDQRRCLMFDDSLKRIITTVQVW